MCFTCVAAAAADGQALAGSAPPLPADPAGVCNRNTMLEATSQEHTCAESLFHREHAVEACCRTLARYYGPNSILPSRNCFCVDSYWDELQLLSEPHYIKWASYLTECTDMGYAIYFYQDGEGPCAGPQPPSPAPAPEPAAEPAPEAEEEPAALPMRAFSSWVAGLGGDAWGAVSFTAAILSVLGTSMMAWTFVYDACCDLSVCYSSRRGRTLKA
ncbi:hypothetical protein ABPG75_003951 [Micractinium tetrahymenae]